MATVISEIDLYTALRDKLGDTETRDLIQYVKANRQEVVDEIKVDKGVLATKEDIALLKSANREDIANLRADMEKGFKEQLRWVIVLLIGFASLIITVIKLL